MYRGCLHIGHPLFILRYFSLETESKNPETFLFAMLNVGNIINQVSTNQRCHLNRHISTAAA